MRHFLLLLLAAALMGGCSVSEAPQFHATDITGANYAKAFTLNDHTGAPRSLKDFNGKLVLLFFGYTQCPDVCPSTLSNLAEVMKRLGPQAGRLQVLFITVDPERDTQSVLSEYIPAFNPAFLGLRGTPQQTAAVMKEFRVYAQKQGDIAGGAYTVDHTAGSYVFDPQGRVRLYIRHGETPENIAADLKQLLAAG